MRIISNNDTTAYVLSNLEAGSLVTDVTISALNIFGSSAPSLPITQVRTLRSGSVRVVDVTTRVDKTNANATNIMVRVARSEDAEVVATIGYSSNIDGVHGRLKFEVGDIYKVVSFTVDSINTSFESAEDGIEFKLEGPTDGMKLASPSEAVITLEDRGDSSTECVDEFVQIVGNTIHFRFRPSEIFAPLRSG
jgi:hypothetical protein